MTEDDAFGRALLDELDGEPAIFAVERDDGFLDPLPASPFFAPARRWSSHNRAAMRYVLGRVLDVGCGAGRHALHLQERGREVVAIDPSPGAVEVCRRRGLEDVRPLRAEDVGPDVGPVDTILLMGGNLGLLGGRAHAHELLRHFSEVTTERGRIVADTRDPYVTDDAAHRAYHERNRHQGRLGGRLRIRVRYRHWATAWFDYLLLSRAELEELVEGTGWEVFRYVEGEPGTYAVVLRKEGRAAG